jgi:hypothetical protein
MVGILIFFALLLLMSFIAAILPFWVALGIGVALFCYAYTDNGLGSVNVVPGLGGAALAVAACVAQAVHHWADILHWLTLHTT